MPVALWSINRHRRWQSAELAVISTLTPFDIAVIFLRWPVLAGVQAAGMNANNNPPPTHPPTQSLLFCCVTHSHTCSSAEGHTFLTLPPLAGVGLNTKAGTARFIKGLAARLGPDLKPAAPTLLKPLVAAVTSESSGQVKKAYAAAAAALAVRSVGDKRQEKFVTDAVAAYGAVAVPLEAVAIAANGGQQQQQQPSGGGVAPMTGVESSSSGGDDSSRQAGGLLLRELLRESGDTFSKYASQV